MEWIQCDEGRLDELSDFYDRVVTYLEAHINYPKWSHAYPCYEVTIVKKRLKEISISRQATFVFL